MSKSSLASRFVFFVVAFITINSNAFAQGVSSQPATLYERLGGKEGVAQIVQDTIANHQNNPAVSHYFENINKAQLTTRVIEFFSAGTGGPSNYSGRDMTSTHAEMGLSNADFDSVVADVLRALSQNNIGKNEMDEVAGILESLRGAVLGAP